MIILLLVACYKEPVDRKATDNPEVPVEKLFTQDGCAVYRFEDGGRMHYFAKCENATATAMSTESCGKNCIRDVEIPTVNAPQVETRPH